MKKHYGLTGNPLFHSFSEKYFNEKFLKEGTPDFTYSLFPLADISEIRQVVTDQHLSGFNVTIPHKTAIIPLLDELSEEAQAIGAVNTVKATFTDDRIYLKGYNTDAPAFRETLNELNLSPHTKALVLGNGGASKAVQYALRQSGIHFQLVSRNPGPGKITYPEVTKALINEHLLIVNTTPLGMIPFASTSPAIPYDALTADHIVYDLVYNPQKTKFLKKAEIQGAHITNGLKMLYLQAELAWKIWQTD